MAKNICVVSHQGGRDYMEDTYFLISRFGGKKDWILGGVFDGHGGAYVARFASKKIPELVLKNLNDGMKESDAFKKAYEDVCRPDEYPYVGCCALTFLIKGDDLYVANSGDCRMIMVSKGRIDQITIDHRIYNPPEKERILKSGGRIYSSYARREMQVLMPTRTIGDGFFKEIGIITEPEIFHRKFPKKAETFLIAATDGLWDERDNVWVADICESCESAKMAANKILSSIVGFSSEMPLDNISMIAIKI